MNLPAQPQSISLACNEQREAWGRGVRRTVEELLCSYPELNVNDEGLLDLIYQETILRQSAGEFVEREEYLIRFPRLASALNDLFDVHEALDHEHVDGLVTAADVQVLPCLKQEHGPSSPQLPSDETTACDVSPDKRPAHDRRLPVTGDESGASLIGHVCGDYELLEVVARGGMGIVFRARQLRLNRIVALKMIRSGQLATSQEVDRFQTEARLAASLRHPNIVTVHEVDSFNGQHFFSMDYVAGPTLEQLVRNGPLSAMLAARHVRTVAQAVQYAHDRQILHRDIKPSNILFDDRGEPHVADFGVCKRFDSELDSSQTQTIVGTPSYMPPEQVNRRLGDTTPRSDVYSLGAVLYEALTGRPPFRAATSLETMLQVVNNEPPPPRLLNSSVPRDLETICLKCLDKDPKRRYASAGQLADDLNRFLHYEPITAKPTPAIERLWRKCSRNKLTACLTVLATCLTLFLLIASPIVAHREQQLRKSADVRRQQAERQLRISQAHHLASRAQLDLDQYPQRSLLLAVEASRVCLSAGEPVVPAAEQMLRDAMSQIGGIPLRALDTPIETIQITPDGRWLVVHHANSSSLQLWDLSSLPAIAAPIALAQHAHPIEAVAVSPDGRLLASVDQQGCLLVFQIATKHVALESRFLLGEPADSLQFSPRGDWLAVIGASQTRLWSISGSSPAKEGRTLDRAGEPVAQVIFSGDGRWLATVDSQGDLELWKAEAGTQNVARVNHRIAGEGLVEVRFSADGDYLAAICSSDGSLEAGADNFKLWRIDQDGKLADVALPSNHQDQVTVFAFDSGSGKLAAGDLRGVVKLWDLSSDERPTVAELGRLGNAVDRIKFDRRGSVCLALGGYHSDGANEGRQMVAWRLGDEPNAASRMLFRQVSLELDFDASGSRLVAAGSDAVLTVLGIGQADWGNKRQQMRGHEAAVTHLVCHPHANWAVSASKDGDLRLWNLDAPFADVELNPVDDGRRHLVQLRELPAGKGLLLRDNSGALQLRPPPKWDASTQWHPSPAPIQAITCSDDGDWLFAADGDGRIRVLSIGASGQLEFRAENDAGDSDVHDVATDRSGRLVATVAADGTWALWRNADGRLERVSETEPQAHASSVDVHPDGQATVVLHQDGSVVIYDLSASASRRRRTVMQHKHAPGGHVGFSRDGEWVISTSRRGECCISRTNAPGSFVLHGEATPLLDLALAGDCSYLTTSDASGRVYLWPLQVDDPIAARTTLYAPAESVDRLAISRDGRLLMAGGASGSVRLWRILAHYPEPVILRGDSSIKDLTFSHDGRFALALTEDDKIRFWKLRLDDLAADARSRAGRRLTPDELQEISALTSSSGQTQLSSE